MQHRKLQQAADAAAVGAAIRLHLGEGAAGATAMARHLADRGGAAAATLALASPPAAGAAAGDATAVEVTLAENRPRLFTRIYDDAPVAFGARAVAVRIVESRACVLALSPTAPGALTAGGSANVSLAGCDLASNSTAADAFDMVGGAVEVEAGCLTTVGGADVTGGLTLDCGAPREDRPATADPYAGLPTPARVGPCDGPAKPSGVTLTPTYAHPSGMSSMRFCGGFRLSGDVTLRPGLYIIEGDFQANGSNTLQGDGVVILLTGGGEARMNGAATLRLTAPSAGVYAGVTMFGDRADAGAGHVVNGNVGTSFGGALYFPAADVTMSGSAVTGGGCMQLIGRTVEFSGNGLVNFACDASDGADILSRVRFALAE